MTEPVSQTSMSQADYMQIFMQELTYQDPLKPVDNKEFMAQMAQFSALQQATKMNENLESMLKMTSSNQALSLLGRHVYYNNGQKYGIVNEVVYENEMPKLKVHFEEWDGSMKGHSEVISLKDVSKIGV